MDLKESISKLLDDRKKIEYSGLTKQITALMLNDFERNFAFGGRWDGKGTGLFSGGNEPWLELSEFTIRRREEEGYGDTPLIKTRHLLGNIDVSGDGTHIEVTAGADYAGLHQFGGKTVIDGRNVYIPARPFITLTPQDVDEIIELINKYIT